MAKTQFTEAEHEIEAGPDFGEISCSIEDDEDLRFRISELGIVTVRMTYTGPGCNNDVWEIRGEFDHGGAHKYLDGTYNARSRTGNVKVLVPKG